MAYDRVLIRDLGSRNGVRVNGRLVDETRLHPGDELAIGPILFRLEAEADEAANIGSVVSRPNQPPRAARPGSAPANVQAAPSRPHARPDSETDLVPLDDFWRIRPTDSARSHLPNFATIQLIIHCQRPLTALVPELYDKSKSLSFDRQLTLIAPDVVIHFGWS
jgi:hypothetical protein